MKTFNAGSYCAHEFHRSFKPTFLCRNWQISDMNVISLLSEASGIIGKLDMFSEYIPDIDLYIRMHVAHEATQSSKIEGTQTRFDEAIKEEKDIPQERRDDWLEVQNYIRALNFGIEKLGELPLCGRLICNTHSFLMQGERGQHKLPGQFRVSQNWIGGASIKDAMFVPPHQDFVPELMGDLDKFMNAHDALPPLLKIALIHYQFETIHPFRDGNGRVGRLLIPLYLMDKKILRRPILYMSAFLERHRDLYYDKLMFVRNKNDMTGWVKFFLVGIIETAKSGIEAFDKILRLKEQTNEKIHSLGKRAQNAKKIMDILYAAPITDAAAVMKSAEVSQPTAYNILRDMQKLGILKKVGTFFVFEEYISIFSKPKDFSVQ